MPLVPHFYGDLYWLCQQWKGARAKLPGTSLVPFIYPDMPQDLIYLVTLNGTEVGQMTLFLLSLPSIFLGSPI